jgi:hypothetical protein
MNPRSYAHLLLTEVPKTYDEQKTASSINFAGKLDIGLQKTESGSRFFTLYMYKLKVDQGS